MDRCLRIPDVLLEIFDHLETDKVGHDTIVTLARTSSLFHDFAARILWKERGGLDVILDLFPLDTFAIGQHGSLHLSRNGSLQLDDGISRLKKYARHVKVLRFNFDPQHTDRDRLEWRCLLSFLTHPNFPKPIFPNLIALTLPCFESRETMLYASLTLAPSVRSVTVLSHSSFSPDASALSRDESLWKALADQLDPHSEVLTSFTITSWQFHGSVSAEVLGIVDKLCQKFTALTTLSVPKAFIPPAALQSPSRLEVSIRCSVNPQGEMILPGLANLHLSVTSAEGCNIFLRSLLSRNLDSLTIHYSSAVSTKNINLQDTFSALLASSDFPHLSSVTVHGDKSGLDERFDPYFGIHLTPPTTFPITYGVLEPLMSCQGMTRITITNCILEISNNDLLRMLSAWPKLTVLKLASAFQVNDIPQLSLAGLHTALLRCPLLSHLDLPCDARTLPSTGAAPHPHYKPYLWGFSACTRGICPILM